jgi:hypothetical protein
VAAANAPEPAPASTAPPAPASTPTIWGQGSTVQGKGGEAHIGATQPGTHFFGTFRQFDGAVYGSGGSSAPALEVSQTKTIDTTLKSYQGSGLRNLIEKVAGELGGVGESQWEGSGFTMAIGPQTQRVLNVVLPQTALTVRQQSELATAVAGAQSMGVDVRVFRVP